MDILQWNVNGYFRRLEYIKLLVSRVNPTCICLQETNLSNNCGSLQGYQGFFRNRTSGNRASGGVAIFVKPHTIAEEIQLTTNIEAIAIKVKVPLSLTICNVYLPNSQQLNLHDLNLLIRQLPIPFILLGDFNSHHFYWGSQKSDTRGRIIAQWIDDNDNMILLNNGQPTHFDSNTGRTSIIDLAVASQSIVSYFDWNAIDELYDSDHFPILIRSRTSDLDYVKCPKKWKFDKANWETFQEEINKNINKLPSLSELNNYSINNIVENFTNLILESADKSIPKTSEIIRKNNLPWWNEECKKAVKDYKKAFRKFKKQAHNLDNNITYKIDYKKKRSLCRRILKETKKKYWENWVSSITPKTPINDMWKKIHCLDKNKKRINTITLEKENGSFVTSPAEVSDLLAKTFSSNSSCNNYDKNFITYKNSQELLFNFNTADNKNPINSEIYLHELLAVLSNVGNTSPGPDNLPNTIIKNLPYSGIQYLLQIYNHIWTKQVFPDNWREAVVIPILKPGKIPTSTLSYRPISLTCNLCKILEKIISKRLRWYLESNNYLSQYQYGFRQYRSTYDHLINLESEILDNFVNDNYTIIIALDIEKAYEMVWNQRILKLLNDMGIKGNMLAFIRNFLRDRKIRVRLNEILSDPQMLDNGLPQGSVVSVVLFLIAINDVLSCLIRPVKGFLFADDLTIICSGRSLEPIIKLLQNVLNRLQEWAMKTGFKFSKTKTEFIIVSKKRNKTRNINLTLNGSNIKEVKNLKILGLTFDKKMTWIDHINNLKSECHKRLNILKVLSSKKWGADRKCLLQAHQSIVKQKIDYGSIIYDSAQKRTLQSLEAIHNQGLRLSIGAFKTSPVKSILAEAEDMPLEFRRKELVIMFSMKILSRPQSPTYNYYVKSSILDTQYELKPKLIQPFRIRAAKYLNELNIDVPPIYKETISPLKPWDKHDLPVNFELSKYQKEHTPQYIYKNLFHELNNKYTDHIKIYTDGSVMNEKSGCAVVFDSEIYRYRLREYFSVFSCEATAILEALKIVKNSSIKQKYIIYTDSKSCLTAIVNDTNNTPVIKEIKLLIITLIEHKYNLQLIWIPSHQGITGNDKADLEAKNATNESIICDSISSSIFDLRKHVRYKIKNLWNHNWKINNTSKLLLVRDEIFDKSPISFACRNDQTVITRLRIGHTNLTHIHLITKQNVNKCKCGAELSVSHLLIECAEFNLQKRLSNLPDNLKECLNGKGCNCTLKYLKLINMYKCI